MTAIDLKAGLAHRPLTPRKGPVTIARQRRTLAIYLAMVVAGLLPSLLQLAPGLQAAGLGLIAPGAGFFAVGGWAMLLVPLTLLLFVASCVAWFWAGMVLAPVTVWLGSALLAGAIAGESLWPPAPFAAVALAGAVALGFRRRTIRLRSEALAKGIARETYVPQSLAEVQAEAADVPDIAARELTPDQLSSLRYLLDRALQPIDQWGGFDVIDQFQPAALRYQINHMGFALGIAQTAYVPSFTGYMGQAQRNLIEKYLLRKVWGYWVYESCWGHLNFSNWDPADRDNIMLTGWFGMHVGQYMLATGDRRYLQPGSLSFRLNERTTYVHDFKSIIGSVTRNYDSAEFGHYACEPNWIYPICNHYGMASLAVADAVTGSDNVARYLPGWFAAMDTEFTDEGGSIIGLRSQHTGLPVPFPVTEFGYAPFENVFAPDRAQKQWATARRELAPLLQSGPDGRLQLKLPGKGLDTGNYRPGHTGAYASILVAAREFGDDLLAEAAQAGLDADCAPEVRDGVRRYTAGSNDTNAYAVLGSLIRTGDFRRSFAQGPAKSTRTGPILAGASYPDVLVARAYSDGSALDLTLYPGRDDGAQLLTLARLQPGRRYRVEGAIGEMIEASADGTADIRVSLSGRTVVRITPA
jgi:hypothetical protein